MSKFEQFKRYPTRNGGEALILAYFRDGKMKVSLYTEQGDFIDTATFQDNGQMMPGGSLPFDIVGVE